MQKLLRDILEVLLSEFEGGPFSLEEALDYLGFGESHILFELLHRGILVPEAGKFRILNAEQYLLNEGIFPLSDLRGPGRLIPSPQGGELISAGLAWADN
jgi:hypothetical protein